MGSRASTLLRDEELEEIKKETGCESGLGSGHPADRLRLASAGPELGFPGKFRGKGNGGSWAVCSSGASGSERPEELFAPLELPGAVWLLWGAAVLTT